MNNVNIIGRLGRDPEMAYFESGKAKTSFTIAVDSPSKEKKTFWFDVQCWDKTAEVVGEHCRKGRQVGITGRLEQQTWEDKNGEKHSRVIILADRVDFLAAPKDAEE